MGYMSMAQRLSAIDQGIRVGALPHWLFMPRNGRSFNYAASIALPAAGAQADIISFQVPKGFRGVINLIANQVVSAPGFIDGSGALVWQILQDGAAERDYENIVSSLGIVSLPSQIAPIFIMENVTVELLIQNISLANAGVRAQGRLGGWFYPIELDITPEGDTF